MIVKRNLKIKKWCILNTEFSYDYTKILMDVQHDNK